jgi:hypothetical protein
MAYIGKKPEDLIRGNSTYNSFTGDGSTTAFDVTNILPDGGQYDVEVFVDNVRQEAGASKSYTIGNDGSGDLKRITFNVAPDSDSEIYVINPGRETSLITVNDNTISAAKIQSDAVITAKILDSNVTTGKIAADAITGAKIADDAINSEHITDGSVDNVHLAGSIANAKLANSSITINGTAVSLGGSVTAGTDWQAVVVADGSTQLTAAAGKGYFLDTNTGVIEVFLPASPTRGDTIILVDYSGTFSTNMVIVNTGGKLIDSTIGGPTPGNEFKITTNNSVVELVFVDNDKGWLVKDNTAPSALNTITASGGGYNSANFIEATGGTVSETGDYKIHQFTGDGNFVVSRTGTGGDFPAVADYLVVAGGGGGGYDEGGGGGGGGFRESSGVAGGGYTDSPLGACVSGITLSAITYPITVGAGGVGGSSPAPGANSVFSTITSAGGGAGGRIPGGSPACAGAAGGSGGASRGTGGTGGAGNTPPVSPPQGTAGATADGAPGTGGGGGGGATQAGAGGGNGGNGATTNITASPVVYSGGGGGTGGTGGTGGAGNSGASGSANTGGGGGGTCTPTGSAPAGGKGIVVIRYKFK